MITRNGPQRPVGFSPTYISSLINEEVIQQHAEDAAFLWTQRDAATTAPHYNLKDLTELDERVEANIDGLRVTGNFGWKLVEQQLLNHSDRGEIFIAAILAFEAENPERIQTILDIAGSDQELLHPVAAAITWNPHPDMQIQMQQLLKSHESTNKQIALIAYRMHRTDPGNALIDALRDKDPSICLQAIKAAGELGRVDLLREIGNHLNSDNEECRFLSAWASARLGMHSDRILGILREIAEAQSTYSYDAMNIALRCMDLDEAKAWQKKQQHTSQHLRLAIQAIGIIGDPSLIDYLFTLMSVDEHCRVSGESFTFISGVDLAYEDLDGDIPEHFETGPNENTDDDDVSLDVDENLSWAVPDLVQDWWSKNKHQFKEGTRYLCGQPCTTETLGNSSSS